MSCVKRYRLKTLLLLFADDLNSYIASKTEKKLPIRTLLWQKCRSNGYTQRGKTNTY